VVKFAHTSLGETLSLGRIASHAPYNRESAWGSGSAEGVRVLVVDSGVDISHPLVGTVAGTFGVIERDGRWVVEPEALDDRIGHGTACAGIIRKLAPECSLTSLRVLGGNSRGNGDALLAGLEWAVGEGFNLVSISLSTQRQAIKEMLHDLTDRGYFEGTTFVSSAHNNPVMSYPWRFSSVISVGAHGFDDPERIETNPNPPVEFFGAGVRVRVPWPGGATRVVSGNSFATPHITGMCARILGAHPEYRTTQLRHTLSVISDNIGDTRV